MSEFSKHQIDVVDGTLYCWLQLRNYNCLGRKWRNNSDRELFLWDHIARLWQLRLGHAVSRTLMQQLLRGKYLWPRNHGVLRDLKGPSFGGFEK